MKVIQDSRSNRNISTPFTWIRAGESWDDKDALPGQVLVYDERSDGDYDLVLRVFVERNAELLKAVGDVANELANNGMEVLVAYTTLEADWPDVLEGDSDLLTTAEVWN